MPLRGTSAPARVVGIDAGDHRERLNARRNKLVTDHLDMVDPIARDCQAELPPCFEFDDLLQAGRMGLLEAATRYRPAEHNLTPFRIYARSIVYGRIMDSARRKNYREATRPPIAEDHLSIADTRGDQVVSIETKKRMKPVLKACEHLSPLQAKIVAAYYSTAELSLPRVAQELGISENKCVKEHRKAIGILRERLHARAA